MSRVEEFINIVVIDKENDPSGQIGCKVFLIIVPLENFVHFLEKLFEILLKCIIEKRWFSIECVDWADQ